MFGAAAWGAADRRCQLSAMLAAACDTKPAPTHRGTPLTQHYTWWLEHILFTNTGIYFLTALLYLEKKIDVRLDKLYILFLLKKGVDFTQKPGSVFNRSGNSFVEHV